MLDPLTAISLAGSVIQFVDFGLKVVRGSIELYESVDGSGKDKRYLEGKITQTRQFADRLDTSVEHSIYDDDDDVASRDRARLIEFAQACRAIASELLAVLESLKVKKSAGFGRTIESMEKTFKAQLPSIKKKIDLLEKELNNVRRLALEYIQYMMNEEQSRVLKTLKDLANENLLLSKNEILKIVKDMRDESSAAMADLSAKLSALAESSQNEKILCVLNSLDFETRQSRQSDIADTEYRTFEWIFDDHHGPYNRPLGFRKWLESGNDIYWISGKAGSGKSVLMNFIVNEPRTVCFLRSWAGSIRLEIAKYYFWNAGAPMQKSQQGLLQSLLREILGKCPELIPTVCPSRWKRYHDIGAAWTRQELTQVFEKLSQESLVNIRFCFFVDGVDEFAGEDYTHIIQVLKDLNASPSIKICLSSRPWNIFDLAFGMDPEQRLLLEDHNADDIQIYIKNRFERDEQFALLETLDPRTSELVNEIVKKAQGVFLWVRIVVENLLRGVYNGDVLSDLRGRLQTFPSSLTAYYEHMLDSIDVYYREETAEILLICLKGIQPLALLTLWYYEKERRTPDYALQAPMSSLDGDGIEAVFKNSHKRIKARVQDLLTIEVNDWQINHLKYTVRFTHLTVKDFLSRPEVMRKLSSWASTGFNARVALCKATLATIKSLAWPTPKTYESPAFSTEVFHGHNIDRWWKNVSNFFEFALLVEKDERPLDNSIVEEFGRVLPFLQLPDQQKSPTGLDIVDESDDWPTDDTLFRNLSRHDPELKKFSFAWAFEANLKSYVRHKLAKESKLLSRPLKRRPVLDRMLRPSTWRLRRCGLDPDMIRLLLMHGANPNEEFTLNMSGYVRTTVWVLFLQQLYTAKSSGAPWSPAAVKIVLEIARLMIEHGAAAALHPWRILELSEPFSNATVTPSSVFHEVFPRDDAIGLDQLLRKHRPRALRRAYALLRRTVILWFYRNINICITLLPALYTTFFNPTLGVILPMVIIPSLGYFIVLAWPYFEFIMWCIAPAVLPCLILSDWIPALTSFARSACLYWTESSTTPQ